MNKTPLIILGVDAGDPAFIERWAGDGHLPAIASIMERGAWGRTGGPELISEHGAWMSIFSGISRRDHGYYYYRQLRPGTYDLHSMTGLDIAAPPFWTRLDGRQVVLLDVPDTDIVSGLPGIQLVHWATHNNWDPEYFVTASEPPDLLPEIERRFGEKHVTMEKHDSTAEEDTQILDALLKRVRSKGAMCRHVLSDQEFDLMVTVFAETHAANHQFWRYCPLVETHGDSSRPELTNGIREVYQAVDREIGALLETLPTAANVVVVSSVGMNDDWPTSGLAEAFCRGLGYQHAPAGGSGGGVRDWARRIIPEPWRAAISRRIHSRAQREALLADQFRRGTDWARTTAFAIPSAYTTFLRVNLRGREPLGQVEPGREYDSLLDRLESDLEQLVDPVTGERAVTGVARTTALFDCPIPASLPDLFVDWKAGRYMDRVVHPRAEIVQEKPDFFRRSDHSESGFFAATGPGIAPLGDFGSADVLDLCPTFLSLLDLQSSPGMRGKPLRHVLAHDSMRGATQSPGPGWR